MLRYKNLIQIDTNRNGIHSIKTDMGQCFLTTLVNSFEHSTARTKWWEMQSKTALRELQKDVFLGEFDRLYRRLHWANDMQYYLVYEQGKGYAQPHDIVFARIPRVNLWLLGSGTKCWVQQSKYESFSFNINSYMIENIEDLDSRQAYYKEVLEPLEEYVREKEEA